MTQHCAACGKDNPEEARFCMGCGTALADVAPAPPREVRRVVTVLFADMVGFTSLGERLDQESLRRVMDRFYAEMRVAIEAHGGTLAKFIGDAVLAVWGTPEVREDDALRAVRAAEAMRRSLDALNDDLERRWGVRVGVRIGVNTGEVVVDPTRPADLLVGDTLNVAARLEQAAADGEVLVGSGTFPLVRDGATLEAVAPLALKGKARPMPAWRLVDGLRPAQDDAPQASTPLVGREDELGRLRAAFDIAVETGHFGLVTVVGSAGLGKTRLAAELAAEVAGRADVLGGRCEASDEGITFLPVAEVLRAAAGIDEQDGPDAARERLTAALAEDERQRERIVERAGSVLGLAPPAAPEETFWGVRRFLEGRARERPLVVVLDDIHWGQPTFLDLLEHLAEWGRARVLLVALARPELREIRPSLTEGAIDLAPLGAGASRALIEEILGTARLPPELEERVLETTDGNPFFLAEVLRMLVEEGALRRDGDAWITARGAGAIAVPATIQALLATRIERLGEGERDVVERAAVIGHQFYRGAVGALASEPVRARLDEHLVALRSKDLVRPEELRWLDEDVFRFHHVLIRDAAYRRLLKEARADLHERFASWLEAKAGGLAGEHDEVIAFHLEQAHGYRQELGPLDDEGRSLGSRATERLHSAGRRALAREDLPAAINLLHRALRTLGDDDAARVEVLVDLAEALVSAGDTTAAEQVVEELGLGADEASDMRISAWATVLAGHLDNLTGAGHVRETAEAAAEAAAILEAAADHRGAAKAHQVVAQAEALLGRVAKAEAALDRALVAARAADDRRRVTAVLSGAPRAALWGPTPIVRASGRCLDVVRILRMTPGNRHVEAAALRCQAVLEAMRGRAEAARGIVAGCRTTFHELGLALELHETDVYAGIVELLADKPAAAEARLAPARDGLHALGVDGAAAQASALLARALLAQGREQQALDATRFAEEHAGEDLKTTIAWLGVRAEALALRGDGDEARALATRAVELAEPTDALADKADALMALAAVEAAAGDATASARAARRARDLYAAKDHAVGVARADALAPAGSQQSAETEPEDIEARLAATAAGRAQLRFSDGFNTRDWDAMRAACTDDYEQVDRREVGWERITSADELVDFMRTWAEAAGDASFRLTRLLALDEHVIAAVVAGSGTFEGGPFEIAAGAAMLYRGEQVARAEFFDVDDEAAILAAYERLCRDEPAVDAPAASSSGLARGVLANLRQALLDRDWVRMRAAHTSDAVRVDRRPGRRNDLTTPDQLVKFWQSIPLEDLVMEPIAVRASWLLATHLVLRGTHEGSAWEAVVDEIMVLDAAGRLLHLEGFEPEDRATLLARLDELEAQGPPPPLVVRVVADREVVATRGDRCALLHAGDALSVVAVDAEGEVVLDEPFGRDEEQAAHARLDEVADSRAVDAGPLAAAAPRLGFAGPFNEAFNGRDLDVIGTLVSDDLVFEDHRPGMRHTYGKAGWMESWRQTTADVPDVRLDATVLAGTDRVNLVALRWTGGRHSYEILVDGVATFDEHGVQLSADAYERGDTAAWARYEELASSPPSAAALSPLPAARTDAFHDALRRRDWDRVQAMCAPDMVAIDLRRGIRSEIGGRDDAVAAWRSIAAADATWEPVTQVGDWLMAVHHTMRGRDRDGVEWESVHASITVYEQLGRAVVYETYDIEDRDTLLARVAELEAEGPPPTLVDRTGQRWSAAFAARDWEALEALYTEDAVFLDRRPMALGEAAGAGRLREVIEGVAAMGPDTARSYETVASRGDRFRLSRMHWSGHDPSGGTWEMETLAVIGVAEDGRLSLTEMFNTADEDDALARLDEVADAAPVDLGPLARPGKATELATAWLGAFNRADLPALSDLASDDLAFEDHRPMVRHAHGKAAWLVSWRQTFEDAPDTRVDAIVLASTDRVSLVTQRWGGRRHSFEMLIDEVALTDEQGRLVGEELFEHGDPAAWARFQELAARSSRVPAPPFPPYAALHCDALCAAVTSRDRERLRALYAPDLVSVDRRRGIRSEFGERDEILEGWRSVGASKVTWEPLEQRADWLVTIRLTLGGRSDQGIEWESVIESIVVFDHLGRGLRNESFEPGDRDALLARLDELEREGPPPALVERTGARWRAAFAARDWPAVEALYTEDASFVDRRPVARGEPIAGAAGYVELLQGIAAMGADAARTDETLALRGDRLRLARLTWTGHDDLGGAFEVVMLGIVGTAHDGRVTVSELFGPEDERAAHTRLDELADPLPVELGPLAQPGAATPVSAGWFGAFNRRDLDALAPLVADDFVYDDHRPLVRHSHGKERWLETWRQTFEDARDSRVEGVVLAATDRVSIGRARWLGKRHSYELVVNEVACTDEAGRLLSEDIYEVGDPTAWARYEELTARLPPRATLVERALSRWAQAFAARDWNAIEAVYTDDVLYVDRRPMAREELVGAQALRKLAEGVAAMGPDTGQTFVTVAVRGERHCLSRARWSGHDPSGGAWENETLSVIRAAEDGRLSLTEMFDPGDEEKALERLDELAGAGPVEPAAPFSPLTVAHSDALVTAVSAGDWALVRDLYAPDVVAVDRRRGIRSDIGPREAVVASWRSIGAGSASVEPLLQPTDWLAAFRVVLRGTGHADVEWEAVLEMIVRFDATGRSLSNESFDPGDRALLLRRLGEFEREGPPLPLVERIQARWREAFAARDWAAIEALCAPGAVLVDHRPIVGERASGPTGFRDLLESVSAMGADTRWVDGPLGRRGARHRLTKLGFVGHDERGGEWALDMLAVTVVDDHGRIARCEVFANGDEAAAHARLDELADPHAVELGPFAVPGAATAHSTAWFTALNAGDVETLAALTSDDFAFEDHRPLVRHAHGKATWMEGWRKTIADAPDVRVDGVAVAATDRACLTTVRWTGRRHSYEIDFVAVALWDEKGRLALQDIYEHGDPAAWERYRELTA